MSYIEKMAEKVGQTLGNKPKAIVIRPILLDAFEEIVMRCAAEICEGCDLCEPVDDKGRHELKGVITGVCSALSIRALTGENDD